MNEQLSAFLDGEANRDEADSVVSALLRDDALRDSWSRQHWIRTTLRAHSSEIPVEPDIDFSRRVMASIAADGHHERVSPISATQRSDTRTRRPRRWRNMAGVGMAAAVAGVVLMSGNPFMRSSGGEARLASSAGGTSSTTRSRENAAANRLASNEASVGDWNDRLADFSTVQSQSGGMRQAVASMGSAVGVSDAAAGGARAMPAAARSGSDHWSVSDPAVRDELNGYLVDHNGMARGYGMSSTTPGYVRVATYGQSAAQ
ncbi:sigma-E factor negative regulatory protein [Salinisphaera sp. Q1T1-3]|uniref:sigma-E factor negative regulatory protein n=1 Tax=Salinisphaera sp. Q1T1-3 TaxID=2321229 RepID=UPI000E738A58|nr:sigma-E factor negative regulatory protein [Salinisphaera sp. Q1T1-3]RJS92055.1 hypothetical protein D3260_12995 [Salinisphaera sp. Q1T1-3]